MLSVVVTYYQFFIDNVLPLFFDLSLFGGFGEKFFFYLFAIGVALMICLPFVYVPFLLLWKAIWGKIHYRR